MNSIRVAACSFRSAQAATLLEFHVPFTNCFVCRWFCVHDPKPPLHSHNWLSFGKFQDTERFLIHCERHFSSRLSPSGGTWKYAKPPSTKKKLGEILYLLICSFLRCLSWLLRSRVRKSRRDLWITLYIYINPFVSAVFAALTLNGRLRDNHNQFFIVRQAVDFYRYFQTLR